MQSAEKDDKTYTCTRCGITRPDPSITDTIDGMAHWRKYGEGWYVLATWDLHERLYYCPTCAKQIIKNSHLMRELLKR